MIKIKIAKESIKDYKSIKKGCTFFIFKKLGEIKLDKKGGEWYNVKLNLVINGKGTSWIDDIRLVKAPLR